MFTLTERTCLDATKERVVPCNSPEAAFQLGAEGHEIEESEAKKYGLSTKNASADLEDKAATGQLPSDFPGHDLLEAAGINTYGQLRKVDDLTTVAGIGPATAAKITEALG